MNLKNFHDVLVVAVAVMAVSVNVLHVNLFIVIPSPSPRLTPARLNGVEKMYIKVLCISINHERVKYMLCCVGVCVQHRK